MKPTYDIALVTTTIYVPKLLDSYAKDARKYKRSVIFIVVGDKKTPKETAAYCAGLAKRSGIRVEYFSIDRQEKYLKRFQALGRHIPYNCIERRDIGIVYAYELGCETMITIDDDNLRVTDDFLSAHQVTGERLCDVVSSSTDWLNVCAELKERHGRTFYHRGFPMEKRNVKETWKRIKKIIRPVANAGLWLGDPDVDAIERLYWTNSPTEATAYTGRRPIALAEGTWSPFNSQNTAVRRDAIPAYFLSPLVGRFSDIWGSYCFKLIADHLGEYVTFGVPIVKQERNPHNYWRDFDQERYGLALTMRFVDALKRVKLSAKDYRSCFAELTEQLPKAFAAEMKVAPDEQKFLDGYFEGMRVWRDTFASLN
jgi:hypothetical protein